MQEQIAEFVTSLMTKEVITVVLGAISLFLGWKACKAGVSGTRKIGSGLVSATKSIGLVGVLAGTLFLGGLGSAGYGIGELNSWETNPNVAEDFTTQQLLSLADKETSEEGKAAILNYVSQRNTNGFTNSQLLEIHQSNTKQIANFVAEQQAAGLSLTGEQIEALAKANNLDSILNYVNNRDQNPKDQSFGEEIVGVSYKNPAQELSLEELVSTDALNSDRIPRSIDWMMILGGIGATIMALVTYVINKDDSEAGADRPS